MKRFFTKIGRFFWSWGFLKFILGMIALVIFIYVEEDWRGARAWAATKAEWEAKGESFDSNKFIPPPVPDELNLAAIPLFKLEMVKNYDGSSYLEPVTFQHAMRDDLPSLEFPSTGNWQKGELPDKAKLEKSLGADYGVIFPRAKAPDDTLAQFNAIYPFYTEFLAATATRPLWRSNLDYTISPPFKRSLAPITAPLKLSKILTLHAILALDHHQSDLALKDIKINYQLVAGVKRDPTLVGGLVAIGMAAINDAAIYNGLARHAWTDAQLVELDRTLKPIDFLSDYQFAMRSEAVQSVANFQYFKHTNRSALYRLARAVESPIADSLSVPWSDGWWDQNMSRAANTLLGAVSLTDPKAHRVFVDRANEEEDEAHRFASGWTAYAPWNIFSATASGPVLNAIIQYAHAQTWIDEARIACALERYHLVHDAYPDSLDALVPAYIDAVPCDPINGEPYHYHVQHDGTFLLYSVGWNQKDDGGVAVFALNNSADPNDSPQKHGDWVWPTATKL